MQLFHSTPAVNVASIRKRGLLVSRSLSARPAIWTVTSSLRTWSIHHVARRHNARPCDVVTLEFEIPSAWLSRSRLGVWVSRRDIPAERLVAMSFREGCRPWPIPSPETPW